MRAQAQGSSSAANSDGSASRGSVFGHRDSATRASSLSSDGTGAPSRRGRLSALALVVTTLALLAFAPLSQAKEIVKYFGTQDGSGSFAGEFASPRDIAVNTRGVGAPQGTIYVADDNNHRIQRFDRNNRFVSAWGKDVIASTVNERQRLVIDATGGTFTLTFNGATSPPIPFGTTAFNLDAILGSVPSFGGGANVGVSGSGTFTSPFIVTFQGALAATDVPQITVDTSQLTGTVKITTLADGNATTSSTGIAFEICTVAAECKIGVASGGDGTMAGNGTLDNPQSVAVDNDTGNVYVSDRDNRRVNAYDASGNFIASYGWNVVAAGSPDNSAEFQRVTVDATGGTFTLAFGASAPTTTDPLDYNASAATIQSRLEALGDIGAGNVLVSGPNGGPYVIRFVGTLANRNVASLVADATLLTGDNPNIAGAGPTAAVAEVVAGAQATNYEICRAGVDVCQAGSGGAGAGRYGTGTSGGTFGIAVSQPDSNASTGTIFLADTGNRRVNTYSLDGTSFSSFGSSANFGFGSGNNLRAPARVAVDSRGIVYADDTNNAGEVDRFDTESVHGGGANSLLASISASVNEVQLVQFQDFGSRGDTYKLTCPNGTQTADIIYTTGSSGLAFFQEALQAACGQDFAVDGAPNPSTGVTVIFKGDLGSRDVPQMDCLVVSSAAGRCSVTTTTAGRTEALLAAINPSTGSAGGGTPGLAVDPDSDGAGPDEDILYAMRVSSNGAVQQFGPLNDPGLPATPGAADEVHGTGAGFTTAINQGGLGVNPQSGHILVTSNDRIGDFGSGWRVYILGDPLPDPVVILSPVSTKTDTTATLVASVDPQGGLVRCAFEYATEPSFANPTEANARSCAFFNPDGGYQPLRQSATGLDPNTRYFFRLVVTRSFDPTEVVTSTYSDFFTDSVPPVVSDVGAVQVSDASARLVGTIDPKNSATGYVFQYGTTPALGSSTAPVNIGGGTREITVSQVVTGLAKDTDYFFRPVATNEFGSTNGATKTFHTRAVPFPPAGPGNCPNEAIRQDQGSTFLPDCRAYEQVSPADKNQGSAAGRGGGNDEVGEQVLPAISEDGDGIAFCTGSLFGDPAAQQTITCAPYLAKREPGGWNSQNRFPIFCQTDLSAGQKGSFTVAVSTRSFDRLAISMPEADTCPIAPLDPAAPLPAQNFYRQDLTTDPFDFDLLTPVPDGGGVGLSSESGYFAGGSDDFSHVVYASRANQTPDSPAPDSYLKLYDWTEQGVDGCADEGGCLSLVSVRPDDNPFTTESRPPGFFANGADMHLIGSAVSKDGRRVFFQNETEGGQTAAALCGTAACDLYLREDNATTFHVSASECTRSCGADSSPDRFLWANPRGDVALFSSCAKLTDGSSEARTCLSSIPQTTDNLKLYRWDRDEELGSRLIDLSVDEEPADGSQPQALEPIGASDDGETVFFVAGGQLLVGEPTGPGLKLYRWQWNGGSPGLEYLGPYVSRWADPASGSSTAMDNDPNANRVHERVTPDGRYLAIQTVVALDTAADRDADADMYRWDEENGWICVSCQVPGAPSAGPASSFEPKLPYNFLQKEMAALTVEHTISDDGKRIFFSTPDALAPEDVNGEAGCPQVTGIFQNGVAKSCQDVYEWHDGTVSLITPGTGDNPFLLIGGTADGDSVFFATAERLVGWDVDLSTDIYVARTNGGFPEPPPVPPACEGDACRGPGTVVANIPGAGTRVFDGARNPPVRWQVNGCPRGKRRVTRNGRTRCVAKKRKRNNRAAKHNRRAVR